MIKSNGDNKLYIVHESLCIQNQILLMKGDVLERYGTEVVESKNGDYVMVDFEVKNSAWCEGLEISLTLDQVAKHLVYHTMYR